MNHGGASLGQVFAASGPGWLAIVDGTVISELYQWTVKANPSVKRTGHAVGQSPMHRNHSTKGWLE